MGKIENKILDWIEKNKIVFFLIIITILSIYIRYQFLNFKSRDYNFYLEPWMQELKEKGGFKALKYEIGNYNVPYMTILAGLTYLPISALKAIKVVSIFFDYVCALTAALIVGTLIKDKKKKKFWALITYGVVIFLPTIFLNSACWAQCDSIYTAFILLSIYFLMKEKYIRSFIFLGISFAFKIQFMFILPLYILIYLSERKFSCLNFAIIPLMDIIMCIPAMIMGKTIQECINIYLNQTSIYDEYLSMNFPNIYSLIFQVQKNQVLAPNEYIKTAGIIFTALIFILIAFVVLSKKVKFNKQSIIEFGLWSVMIATFFLPEMHDRYLFVGDVLSILYVINNKDKIYMPIGIIFISVACYSRFLFGVKTLPIEYFGVLFGVLLIKLSKDIMKKYFSEDNKLITNDKQEMSTSNV